MTTRQVYLFDIDGTISDPFHRLHLIQNGNKQWDEFFKQSKRDLPIWDVIKTQRLLKKAGALIIMVTGRSDMVRQITEDWMRSYGIPFDYLYMRKANDHREDYIVKEELLNKILDEHNLGLSDIVGVFEDRQQVVDMYRAKGLKVFQVAEGKF